jgi:hypothetical protein
MPPYNPYKVCHQSAKWQGIVIYIYNLSIGLHLLISVFETNNYQMVKCCTAYTWHVVE